MARTIIPWFGGKFTLAPKIAALIPQTHDLYIEPFGGAASVLLAKTPSRIEVYNDMNVGLVSLFRVLRDPGMFAKFYGQLVLTPYGRDEFKRAQERWQASNDEVERALAFYVLARQAFGGNTELTDSWRLPSRSPTSPVAVASTLNALSALPQLHERLRRVHIEHVDWRRCLELYDCPHAIFYLDPPYVPETRQSGGYHHELTLDDHKDLVSHLLTLQGRALLSGYSTEVYKPLEDAGWRRLEWETRCTASTRHRDTTSTDEEWAAKVRRVECLWVHPGIETP